MEFGEKLIVHTVFHLSLHKTHRSFKRQTVFLHYTGRYFLT